MNEVRYLPIIPTFTDCRCKRLSMFASVVHEDSAHIRVLFGRLLFVERTVDLRRLRIERSQIRLFSRSLFDIREGDCDIRSAETEPQYRNNRRKYLVYVMIGLNQ